MSDQPPVLPGTDINDAALDALVADHPAEGVSEAPQALAPMLTNAQALGDALKFATAAAGALVPTIPQYVVPQLLEHTASAMGDLCDHYGVDLTRYLGDGAFMKWAAAGTCCFGLYSAFSLALDEHQRQREAASRTERPAAPPPKADSVTVQPSDDVPTAYAGPSLRQAAEVA